jgi:hypothetical protein
MKSGTNRLPKQRTEEKKKALLDDFSSRVDRAEEGDPEALALMVEYMEGAPGWVANNDLAANAERALIRHIAGEKQPLVKEIFEMRQKQLRQEMAGEEPSPLEKMLIRRVSVCWLQAYHADSLFAQYISEGLRGTEYIQKYQDRAHKRLLSAVKALAQVRRLQLPIVQVNIGEKQVNLAQG